MNPTLRATRAIATEFARRAIWPLLLVVLSVGVVLTGVAIWLVTLNAWWWFLLMPLVMFDIILGGVALVVHKALQLAGTHQTSQQKRVVREYADQLWRLRETVQTPYPLLIFKVLSDVIRPRPDGFITMASHDSRTLAKGFNGVVREFTDGV